MDPQQVSPNLPERPERSAVVKPEDLVAGAPERIAPAEAGPTPGSTPAPQAAAASQAAPVLSADDVAAAIAAVPGASQSGGASPLPASAGDVDVIEPEWVDKAESEVRAHQGDPYGEEEAIEKLQQDYLSKRYGRSVGSADAGTNKSEGK